MTFSAIGENIIILSQEFPHYGKIFRFGLAQPCTYTSPPLPLTLLYLNVCEGSQACLQLFTYDGFSTQDDPPRRTALFLPSCRALLSSTFSLKLFSFSFPLLFTLMSPSFHASNLSSSSAPPFTHHHPSLLASFPILRYPISKQWVSLSSFRLPPTLRILLHHCSSHQTISSHVRKTCRHPSATLDHCYCWESSSSCSALGWQGDGNSGRIKGRKE